MNTETKLLETAQKGRAGIANQKVILTAIILIGLVVGVVLTLQLVSPSIQVAGKQAVELARGQQVDAERYAGLANLYAPNEEARARAIQADATRWEAVAEHFTDTRALNAETARWEGMSDFHLDQKGASERSLETNTARYTALADYYAELGK